MRGYLFQSVPLFLVSELGYDRVVDEIPIGF